MTIQQNTRAAFDARLAVRNHCMATRVVESREHLMVYFPPGYQLDGVRVSMANGVTWACKKAIEKMEATWSL